jgi:hypothetical protein
MTHLEEKHTRILELGNQSHDPVERRDWLDWLGWVLAFGLLIALIVAVAALISY